MDNKANKPKIRPKAKTRPYKTDFAHKAHFSIMQLCASMSRGYVCSHLLNNSNVSSVAPTAKQHMFCETALFAELIHFIHKSVGKLIDTLKILLGWRALNHQHRQSFCFYRTQASC